MEFADFVKMAARNVLIVLVLLMVGAGVGWGLASRETPSYQAEASILFSLQTTESGVGAGNQDLMDRMPTYAELALTSRVLDDVVKSTSYPGGVEVLRNSLEAVAPEGKFLVELRLNDTDRTQVAPTLNALTESYVRAVSELAQGADGPDRRLALSVVEPATTPDGPSNESLTEYYAAAGAVGGAVLGIAVVMLLSAMRRQISKPDEPQARANSQSGSPAAEPAPQPFPNGHSAIPLPTRPAPQRRHAAGDRDERAQPHPAVHRRWQ